MKEEKDEEEIYKAGLEAGAKAEREKIDAIMLKLKENMETAGFKEGWEDPSLDISQYRWGQFSVYEWFKREMRK